MSWIELSLDTTHEAVDWVCTRLAEINYTDEVRINKYILAAEDMAQQKWAFTICLYLPYDAHARANVEKITNLLSPLHRTGLTTSVEAVVVEEKPANAEVESPLVHRIGQRFVVLTPDAPYQPQAADEIPLILRTSLAFGSGFHPATVLSLRLLERYIIPGMNVLDLGSGSGILSVAIAKLGAKVLALDNDSIAVQATQDAVSLNGVEQQVTVMEGSLGCGSNLGHWMGGNTLDQVPSINPTANFDLIVANILGRVHVTLASDFQRALRRSDNYGGLLIAAGFTSDREDEITTAFRENGLEIVDCERLNEWVALVHRLKM